MTPHSKRASKQILVSAFSFPFCALTHAHGYNTYIYNTYAFDDLCGRVLRPTVTEEGRAALRNISSCSSIADSESLCIVGDYLLVQQ
ncbi:hypothetical protein evm_002867 [Chilo suppressalis]|nr:hypothetical protein evm_002867 [Chilo suppressalis]